MDCRWMTGDFLRTYSGIVLMLYPLIGNFDPSTSLHHLSNLAGNPYQTMLASETLIPGGVFDALCCLQVVVHAGGFLPYQAYRMDYAYHVQPCVEFSCCRESFFYIRTNFWFHALIFGQKLL
jgi:hypothetical protein